MLLGLWRGKFFEKAAFYGGTALRLLYGLDRFSEDLDFSLLRPDEGFRFDPYFDAIGRELAALGLDVELEHRDKDTSVESAFLKMNTRNALIVIGVPGSVSASAAPNRLIRVKFEADVDPPAGFGTEIRLLTEPSPIGVRAYTGPSMFASKFHALLARSWKNRVKGRDWYDLVFFVGRGIPMDLHYLQSRLETAGSWTSGAMTAKDACAMLHGKIEGLDIDAAREDVSRFVPVPSDLELWSKDFFHQITDRVTVSDAG
ncbi:MAG: nucleotidyl transferase AbiEii/AbiGii toxin family protein [Spirochaetes bacterium]|nr:nucleotidyl transferase AbiEii/AbiGii toxin family protein [Spirochaetota bacterium]